MLLDCNQDLVGDERAVYDAMSTPSHEIDGTMLSDKKIAKKLGWTVQRVRTSVDLLWERWIKPNL
jgi:hypothetical protein